jgi:hypothetical protein
MKKVQKVINCIFRYEMGFSLENSGFSYLYGSISYLFGYENFGCFFLMDRGPRAKRSDVWGGKEIFRPVKRAETAKRGRNAPIRAAAAT